MLSIIIQNGVGYSNGLVMSSGFGFGGLTLFLFFLVKFIAVLGLLYFLFRALSVVLEEDDEEVHGKVGLECKCHDCNAKR